MPVRRSRPSTAALPALVLSLAFAGAPALAQTSDPPPAVPPSAEAIRTERLMPAYDGGARVNPLNRTVAQIEGAPIRGRWNADVGHVVAVLTDPAGTPVAVAADVRDYAGTSGSVVLPLDQLLDQSGTLMVTLSGPQLDALPRWSR